MLEFLKGLWAVEEVPEERGDFTLADKIAAEYFGGVSVAGIDVSEKSALGVSAWYRGLSIISGTIADLPLKTYRETDDGRQRVKSWIDNPGGPLEMTQSEWVGQVVYFLASGGEVFLLHIRDEAGRIIGAWPVPRGAVTKVERRGYEKWFELATADGRREWLSSYDMTQVMLLSVDGLRGESPLTLFRRGIAINMAGEEAATSMLTTGFLAGGLVTPEGDLEEDEAKAIKAGLDSKVSGPGRAGGLALVNRALKFTPWTATGQEAEFIAQRGFGIEEVARMLGIPRHLLAMEGASDFGTGLVEMNQGLARYTLRPYTTKVEQALSKLLPRPRFVAFDYKGLLEGTPKDEIRTLIAEVDAGLLTKNEARRILNLEPVEGGDELTTSKSSNVPTDPKSQGGE